MNDVELVRIGCLGCVLLRAVYTDVKTGKIENGNVLIGFMIGIILSCIEHGGSGLAESLKMAFVTLVALIFLFIIKGLGAGDIKLFCVLAAFYPRQIVSVIITAFFMGGAIGVGRMVYRWIRKQRVYIFREKMNFSIPIGLGTAWVLVMEHLC